MADVFAPRGGGLGLSLPVGGGAAIDFSKQFSRFQEDVTVRVADLALRITKKHARKVSRTIADDLRPVISFGRRLTGYGMGVKIRTDYYWAKFLHDGHRSGTPKKKFVAFYPVSARQRDPRLRGYGYPKKESDKRSLLNVSRDLLNRHKRKGWLKFDTKTPSRPPFPFFSMASSEMRPKVQDIVAEEAQKLLSTMFDDVEQRFSGLDFKLVW